MQAIESQPRNKIEWYCVYRGNSNDDDEKRLDRFSNYGNVLVWNCSAHMHCLYANQPNSNPLEYKYKRQCMHMFLFSSWTLNHGDLREVPKTGKWLDNSKWNLRIDIKTAYIIRLVALIQNIFIWTIPNRFWIVKFKCPI